MNHQMLENGGKTDCLLGSRWHMPGTCARMKSFLPFFPGAAPLIALNAHSYRAPRWPQDPSQHRIPGGHSDSVGLRKPNTVSVLKFPLYFHWHHCSIMSQQLFTCCWKAKEGICFQQLLQNHTEKVEAPFKTFGGRDPCLINTHITFRQLQLLERLKMCSLC